MATSETELTAPSATTSTHWVHTLVPLLHDLIKWSALVIITLVVTDGVKILAGKTTVTNVSVNLATDLLGGLTWSTVLKHGLSIATLGIVVAWGIRERTLRRHTVTRLQNRIRTLEYVLDPDRSSARRPTPTEVES